MDSHSLERVTCSMLESKKSGISFDVTLFHYFFLFCFNFPVMLKTTIHFIGNLLASLDFLLRILFLNFTLRKDSLI